MRFDCAPLCFFGGEEGQQSGGGVRRGEEGSLPARQRSLSPLAD